MPTQAGSDDSSATDWIDDELRSFLKEYFDISTTSQYMEIITKATKRLEQCAQDTSTAAWHVFLATQAHPGSTVPEPNITELAAVLMQRRFKHGSVNFDELIKQGKRHSEHLQEVTPLHSAVAGQLGETSLPNSEEFLVLPTAQHRRTSDPPPPPPYLTGAVPSTSSSSVAGKRGRSEDELSDGGNGAGDDHTVKKSKK